MPIDRPNRLDICQRADPLPPCAGWRVLTAHNGRLPARFGRARVYLYLYRSCMWPFGAIRAMEEIDSNPESGYTEAAAEYTVTQ